MIWFMLAVAVAKDALTLLTWPARTIGRFLEDHSAEWPDDEPIPYVPTDADDPTPVHDAVAKGLFLEQLEDDDLLAEYIEEWS